METINGISLDTLTFVDLSNVEKVYGGPVQSVLRADLHSELLRISQEGAKPAVLHLSCPVKRVDPATGEVELESGDIHKADLIIGADGARSICRTAVLGYEKPPATSGKNAFRFLIKTEIVDGDKAVKKFIREKPPGANIFADVEDKLKTRHLTWYECHGYEPRPCLFSSHADSRPRGEIQNFVGIFPAEFHIEGAGEPLTCPPDGKLLTLHVLEDQKSMLLQQFRHFHPDIVAILKCVMVSLSLYPSSRCMQSS